MDRRAFFRIIGKLSVAVAAMKATPLLAITDCSKIAAAPSGVQGDNRLMGSSHDYTGCWGVWTCCQIESHKELLKTDPDWQLRTYPMGPQMDGIPIT